jgi:hypothetical protein
VSVRRLSATAATRLRTASSNVDYTSRSGIGECVFHWPIIILRLEQAREVSGVCVSAIEHASR